MDDEELESNELVTLSSEFGNENFIAQGRRIVTADDVARTRDYYRFSRRKELENELRGILKSVALEQLLDKTLYKFDRVCESMPRAMFKWGFAMTLALACVSTGDGHNPVSLYEIASKGDRDVYDILRAKHFIAAHTPVQMETLSMVQAMRVYSNRVTALFKFIQDTPVHLLVWDNCVWDASHAGFMLVDSDKNAESKREHSQFLRMKKWIPRINRDSAMHIGTRLCHLFGSDADTQGEFHGFKSREITAFAIAFIAFEADAAAPMPEITRTMRALTQALPISDYSLSERRTQILKNLAKLGGVSASGASLSQDAKGKNSFKNVIPEIKSMNLDGAILFSHKDQLRVRPVQEKQKNLVQDARKAIDLFERSEIPDEIPLTFHTDAAVRARRAMLQGGDMSLRNIWRSSIALQPYEHHENLPSFSEARWEKGIDGIDDDDLFDGDDLDAYIRTDDEVQRLSVQAPRTESNDDSMHVRGPQRFSQISKQTENLSKEPTKRRKVAFHGTSQVDEAMAHMLGFEHAAAQVATHDEQPRPVSSARTRTSASTRTPVFGITRPKIDPNSSRTISVLHDNFYN